MQLPLPIHLNVNNAIQLINPKKDIDGLHPLNMGYLSFEKNNGDLFNQINYKGFAPATPLAVMLALKSSEVLLEGKNCVVLGRSNLVGLPTFNLLNNNNATVLLAHKQTNNIKEICKQADILVVAIGSANKIDSSYVKENAVVIDVGINTKIVDNKKIIYGDCNTQDLLPIVSKITKVPMGIGRLTVISLMVNITKACYNSGIK